MGILESGLLIYNLSVKSQINTSPAAIVVVNVNIFLSFGNGIL